MTQMTLETLTLSWKESVGLCDFVQQFPGAWLEGETQFFEFIQG